MAVIGKIRSYSGLLIAVIGIALAAFVLGDFMGYGPTGRQNMEVGSIGKSKISYPEFEQRVAQQSESWKQQTGMNTLGPREAFQIRQQVWNQMLMEILLEKEIEKLGISVSGPELVEMIKAPHPAIAQSFANPADGSFDPQMVIEFIQNLDRMDPAMRNQWIMLEQYMKNERRETKYYNLISKGFYMPTAIARADYQEKNMLVDISFLAKRFAQVPDSLVNVTDRDMRKVYEENKQRFKQEESRDIHYVVFPIFPSEQDRNSILREITNLKSELEEAEHLESFINSVSDRRFDATFYGKGQLSPAIDSIMFNAAVGTIVGPFEENNAFILARLNDVQFRPDSMQARHILISHTGSMGAGPATVRSRQEAEKFADSLLTVVRRTPAAFANLATELSEDPSAVSNQGDLGWFPDGAMVKGFNDAVVNTSVNSFTVAETEFGFHIIQVTGKSAATKKVQIAQLVRDIDYSSQTYQRVFGEASAFTNYLREVKDFDKAVEEHGLSKRVIDQVRKMDNSIPGIENPRGIIQWAFSERGQQGSYSQIFDLEGRFVVATVAKVRKEGVPELNDIRNEIRDLAIREKKAEYIAAEFKNSGDPSLSGLSNKFGLEIRELESVRFNTMNLVGFGPEPNVIGAAFAIETNKVSAPITGNAGVFVIEVTHREPVVEPADFTAQKRLLKGTFRNRVQPEVFPALQENADIKDNRHMFY